MEVQMCVLPPRQVKTGMHAIGVESLNDGKKG